MNWCNPIQQGFGVQGINALTEKLQALEMGQASSQGGQVIGLDSSQFPRAVGGGAGPPPPPPPSSHRDMTSTELLRAHQSSEIPVSWP